MKQVKKSKKAMKPNLTLQKKFMSLSEKEQFGVTCFFNAHNTAHYIYDGLSEEAQAYITYCIKLSNTATKIEQEESAQVS